MSVPGKDEAAAYYFTYIDRIQQDDVVGVMEQQIGDADRLFSTISEEKSLHRYAPEKWSIRQTLNHISDTERAFAFRALWFGRGFSDPLASYDQNISASGARADEYSWARHVAEFGDVRRASLALPDTSGRQLAGDQAEGTVPKFDPYASDRPPQMTAAMISCRCPSGPGFALGMRPDHAVD